MSHTVMRTLAAAVLALAPAAPLLAGAADKVKVGFVSTLSGPVGGARRRHPRRTFSCSR